MTTMREDCNDTRRSIQDLHRLLQCMERNNDDDLSSYSISMRAEMAQGMYARITSSDSTETVPAELTQRVEEACRTANERAKKKKEQEVDWVDRIFFSQPSTAKMEIEHLHDPQPELTSVTKQQQKENVEEPQPQPQPQPLPSQQSIHEIQAAQRAQLEEEISHMASQLKASTLRMNQSLKTQAQELDEMGLLAEQNVHHVGKAADDVTAHVKQGWTTAIATWTMMATVVGTFVFVIITIRMIPKRANACIFPFCPKSMQQETMPTERSWEVPCIFYCTIIPNSFGLEPACQSVATAMGQRFLCSGPIIKTKKSPRERRLDEDSDFAGLQRALQKKRQHSTDSSVCMDDTCEATQGDEAEADSLPNDDHFAQENRYDGNDEAVDSTSDLLEEIYMDAEDQYDLTEAEVTTGHLEVANDEATFEFTREDIALASVACDLARFREIFDANAELALQADDNGWTPFIESVAVGCVEVAMFLLDHVPDLNLNDVTSNGGTALWWGEKNGVISRDNHLFSKIQERGGYVAGPEPMLVSASTEEVAPEVSDFSIRAAAFQGDAELLLALLKMAPHLMEVGDENGWRALHEAIRNNQIESTLVLISQGADINARTGLHMDGWSPLALADSQLGEHSEISQLLRSHGAFVFLPPNL